MQEIAQIEGRIDKAIIGATPVNMSLGGVQFTTMMELFELAKMMSVAGTAVPKHLRLNPGACLAVSIQALEWKMSPFAVANKSYEVNDRIAYEAQLIVAVINARAPIKEHLRYTYQGEGLEMQCFVSGTFKGETEPHIYESPKIKDITVKNSPLWKGDPKQQLSYYSGRGWCRRHSPETILGIYAVDEMEDAEPIGSSSTRAEKPVPSIGQRLAGNKGTGFSADGVTKALEHVPAQTLPAETVREPAVQEVLSPADDHAPQLELVIDAENEINAKKKALKNIETLEDLRDVIASTTEYLKSAERTDLLGDFLSAADKRGKAIEKAIAKANPTPAAAPSEF